MAFLRRSLAAASPGQEDSYKETLDEHLVELAYVAESRVMGPSTRWLTYLR